MIDLDDARKLVAAGLVSLYITIIVLRLRDVFKCDA